MENELIAALKMVIETQAALIKELQSRPAQTVYHTHTYSYPQGWLYQYGQWYPHYYGAQGGAGGTLQGGALQGQLNHQQGQVYCGQGSNQGTGGTLQGHISGQVCQGQAGGTSNVFSMTGSK